MLASLRARSTAKMPCWSVSPRITAPVTAASDWGKPAERKRVRPALAGSYEALFHAAQRNRFLLVWSEGDPVAERLRAPRLERAIGVIYYKSLRSSVPFGSDIIRAQMI